MPRKWLVFAAVSLMFFFVTGSTFMSLGVVLYAMIPALHWSQTAAGTSFAVLGLACCLSSPLPALLMNRIGTRWTMLLGGAVLSAGFVCAECTRGIGVFYCGAALMGTGFSLCANIPGVYLLASWFPGRSARIIGLYLMLGASGGVAGPPVASWIVTHGGGWRAHWLLMALLAALCALVCLLAVKDRPAEAQHAGLSPEPARPDVRDWVPRSGPDAPVHDHRRGHGPDRGVRDHGAKRRRQSPRRARQRRRFRRRDAEPAIHDVDPGQGCSRHAR